MHPIFSTALVRDRQDRYRAEAGRSRLARPTGGGPRRSARTGRTDPHRAA